MSGVHRFSHGGWHVPRDRYLEILNKPLTRVLVDLQDLVSRETTAFWADRRVRCMQLPITTNSVSSPMGLGSDSLPVEIDLFGQRTYLSDSMQFLLEYGCRLSSNGAWYMMSSFRGEDSDPSHLNQFVHSEAEVPGTLEHVMSVVEDYVRHLASAVIDQMESEVLSIAGTSRHLHEMAASEEFPKVTFDQAESLLDDGRYISRLGDGIRSLSRSGEQRITDLVGPFVWVTHFDHASVPFYQAYDEVHPNRARNADLLFGIGEVVGGGERHETGDQVRRALAEHGVPEDAYAWYVRLKDERPMLTSGFGMGVERWLLWVLKQSDIREMQIFPRLNGVLVEP